MTKIFILKTIERAAKTFGQAYFLVWFVKAGWVDIGMAAPSADAFDVLFTLDAVKAGVVGIALSVATSFGSKPIGPSSDTPSIV